MSAVSPATFPPGPRGSHKGVYDRSSPSAIGFGKTIAVNSLRACFEFNIDISKFYLVII